MKTCPHCGHKHDKAVETCAECNKPMKKAAENDQLTEGAVLLEGDDLAALVESSAQIIVPKKGPLFEHLGGEEYRGKFALIRPCQSRGRSIRGFQPIYEAAMLAECAAVFSDWPMYGDHLSEALAEEFMEKLQEAGRSIKELGGRVASSWYDPDLVMEGDEEKGYRKGGVVGWVHPQPWSRQMLEADRHILETSINAWPTKVTVGRPSWDTSKKGAVIEGIRRRPMGSVDFVFRGGAGGRPLAVSEEDRQLAVTILESTYPSPREGRTPKEPNDKMKKLSEMSATEIRALAPEKLAELLKLEGGEAVAETVAEAVQLGSSGGSGNGGPADGTPLTAEAVAEMLTEHERKLREGFESDLKKAREEGDTDLREREDARALEKVAHDLLSEANTNGLPQAWMDQLKPRYTVTSTMIGEGLKLAESDLKNGEGEPVSEADAMKARVTADIDEAIKLMEAAGGKPRVKGFGQTAPDPQGEGESDGKGKEGGAKPNLVREADDDAFLGFLRESGDLTGDSEKDTARLAEIAGGR